MMKAIFLDFDGVIMNLLSRHDRVIKSQADMFDPRAIERLNRIIERAGADIIITSRVKDDPTQTLADLRGALNTAGLKGLVVGKTPWIGRREREIAHWLCNSARRYVYSYVILDDGEVPGYEDRHVRPDAGDGLLDHHVDEAVAILQRPLAT